MVGLATRDGVFAWLQRELLSLQDPTVIHGAPWQFRSIHTDVRFTLDLSYSCPCYDSQRRLHDPKDVRVHLFPRPMCPDRPVGVFLNAKPLTLTCRIYITEEHPEPQYFIDYDALTEGEWACFVIQFEAAEISTADAPLIRHIATRIQERQLVRPCVHCGDPFSAPVGHHCHGCVLAGVDTTPESESDTDDEAERCGICRRHLEGVSMACRETFCCGQDVHSMCLRRAVESTGGTCPFCRSGHPL